MTNELQKAVSARLRQWLVEIALPFWMEHGVDRVHGGFVESLDLDGIDSRLPYKRTRVTARQIYVFSQAHLLGFPGARDVVEHGMDHLLGKAWISDEAGFARRVAATGEVIDPTPDLYDLAFALFAISWAYRATRREDLRYWAGRTLDVTEKLLRDTEGEGFWHDAGREGWRQQNPHMHLLEASLAAIEAFDESRYVTLAHEISGLFETRFWDAENGVLPEFFDRNWNPAPDAQGGITEPGHQFEWAWILHNGKRLIGRDNAPLVRALCQSAETRGVDPVTGLTLNQLSRTGKVLDGGSRSWPNTERMKAAVALYELDGTDPWQMIATSAEALFTNHLAHKPAGTWIDTFDSMGAPTAKAIPASTLYHLVLAFAEVLRISQTETQSSTVATL